MLKFMTGCEVPFPEKIEEGYEYNGSNFIANVSADKIEKLLVHFIEMQKEPLYFILRLLLKDDVETALPGQSVTLRQDEYRVDDCTQEQALDILSRIGDLIINDGFCIFGFGCHQSNDIIMVDLFNSVLVFTPNKNTYDGFFEEHGIASVEGLITVPDTFTEDRRGRIDSVYVDGKCIYDIPDMLKDLGIYPVEPQEDIDKRNEEIRKEEMQKMQKEEIRKETIAGLAEDADLIAEQIQQLKACAQVVGSVVKHKQYGSGRIIDFSEDFKAKCLLDSGKEIQLALLFAYQNKIISFEDKILDEVFSEIDALSVKIEDYEKRICMWKRASSEELNELICGKKR